MKNVKARLHPTPALQKAVDEYAKEKIKGIQSRAHEAVMKERNDIATRATYLCLLACYQAGLSPKTLVKMLAASMSMHALLLRSFQEKSGQKCSERSGCDGS